MDSVLHNEIFLYIWVNHKEKYNKKYKKKRGLAYYMSD